MARFAPTVALLVATTALAVAPRATHAQRPALSGEKARVAEAVRGDLSRLSQIQKTYHDRTKLYAADLRDVNFTPASGADISIAFASMNAWAANASHARLSPVKCFVIVSAADAADAPTAQPFCTDADPGTAAGRVAATNATPPSSTTPQVTPARPRPQSTPARQSPPPQRQAQGQPPRQAAPARQSTAPSRTAAPAANPTSVVATGGPARAIPGEARLSTREVIAGASATERGDAVNAPQFADVLAGFAESALAVLTAQPPEIVRDPYESTPEFEQRRAQALAEYQRRETEFFRANTRTYSVQMPVRDVKYDPDREVVEFVVDPVRLPVMRGGGSGGQLSLTCYTRPVFWCSPESGMSYDAGDLWRVPRATARQFDLLRTPMTLTARYTVGRLEGERALAVSLLDMELQAQRWPTR